MKFLSILFLTFSIACFGQESPSTFLNKLCTRIDGIQSVKLNLKVPCLWDSEVNKVPNGVTQYVYTEATPSKIRASYSLVIGNLPEYPSEEEARKELLSTNGLKLMTKGAHYISSCGIKINGVQGGEVILSGEGKTDNFFMAVQNYFIYKKKIVLIQFTYASNQEVATKMYPKYLSFFRSILKKVVFI